MSWPEVKKSINSDINLPLNEKVEKIYGIYPRGSVLKSVSGDGVNGTVLEITNASGIVDSVRVEMRYYTGSTMTITGTLFLDDVHVLTIASKATSYNSVCRITTNLSSVDTSLDMDFPISLEAVDSGSNERVYTINFPLRFKKSMKFNLDVYQLLPNSSWAVSYVLDK